MFAAFVTFKVVPCKVSDAAFVQRRNIRKGRKETPIEVNSTGLRMEPDAPWYTMPGGRQESKKKSGQRGKEGVGAGIT